jgi:FkbH-like protein
MIEIHFVRNYTVEPVGNAISDLMEELKIPANLTYGSYDNLGYEISQIGKADNPPSYLFISVDLNYFAGGFYSKNWNREESLREFEHLVAAVDSVPPQTFVIISNFIPDSAVPLPEIPGHRLMGRNHFIRELNDALYEFVSKRADRCANLDFERIAARLGSAASFNNRFSLMSKSPFTQDFSEQAGRQFIRILKCRHMPHKKVVVLDCDNTLWGGVVGELGPEGIELDPYEYPGIAFYRFQSQILTLIDKGFLICLNSKNDEELVWKVIDTHPHCLIQRNQIAAHRINWTDKATNLLSIADELNLGLDSFVFIDDNPVECELVRKHLPDVTVLQVPGRCYDLPSLLENTTLFDRLSLSSDDRLRTDYYQAEKSRKKLCDVHIDPESFLRDLEMSAVIREPDTGDIQRLTQLCQRTNQFNLTTRRYSEHEIASFIASDTHLIQLLDASDRFGPMGISGLIILEHIDDTVEVDTFLLSCRIIGRGYDQALFRTCINAAIDQWQPASIHATYIQSAKNSVVANLWSEYGFSPIIPGDLMKFECAISTLNVPFPKTIRIEKQQ